MLGELPASEVDRLLQSELIARIGCHVEGRTYVVPVTYAYSDGALVGHSLAGLKLDMLRQNPKVCIEIDRVDDLANWRSVVAWGQFEELKGEEAERALNLLMARFVPLMASETSMPSHLRDPATLSRSLAGSASFVYRILLTEKTGRFERTP
jgi:uncharacterized protein